MKKSILSLLVSLCLIAAAPTPVLAENREADGSSADEAAMYAAYLADLQNHQADIQEYNWQMSDGISHYPLGSEPNALRPVALADIRGDDLPELIYLCMSHPGGAADLRIAGWENGALQELCTFPNWDVNAASGTRYALFTVKGEKTMYAYSYIGDEIGFYSWYRFVDNNGELTADKYGSAEVSWGSGDPSFTHEDIYTANGEACDPAAYTAFANDLISRAETVLIFSGPQEYDEHLQILFHKPLAAMRYEDACTLLASKAGVNTASTDITADTLLQALDGLQLTYSSGVGAWSSDLSVHADGTFTLNYHDSDMGAYGEGYDATLYLCNASGRFDNIQKRNDTTYTMHIAELTLQNTPGEEWIETMDGGRVLHVASEAAGLSGTDTVTVYLPGTPLSDIPEDALFRMFFTDDPLTGVAICGTGDFYSSDAPAIALPSGHDTTVPLTAVNEIYAQPGSTSFMLPVLYPCRSALI